MSDSASRETALEQRAFDEWSPALRALFDGTALAGKAGFTASLVAIDANGHARTSLLSVGELYAPDSRTLCFALWPSSRSARALHERGQAALTFVHDEAFYQVQLDVQPLSDDDGAAAGALAAALASATVNALAAFAASAFARAILGMYSSATERRTSWRQREEANKR